MTVSVLLKMFHKCIYPGLVKVNFDSNSSSFFCTGVGVLVYNDRECLSNC